MKQRIDFALQPVSLGPNFIAFAVDVPVQPCKNGEIGPFTRKTTTSDGTTALTYYKLTDDFAKDSTKPSKPSKPSSPNRRPPNEENTRRHDHQVASGRIFA